MHASRTLPLLSAALLALPAAAAPAKVAGGAYECWANGAARMLMNFKVTGDGRYSNEDGNEKGAFAYTADSGLITFKGGHLDGAMPDGFKAVYHENHGRPTVSFRSGRGSEAAFCERAGR
jgi:hypothetical protein